MRARDLGLILLLSGCSSVSFDGYSDVTVGPFFSVRQGPEREATVRPDVEDAVRQAIRGNQVFPGGEPGRALYIFGFLGDGYLSAVILDEECGVVLDAPIFQPDDWDLSGPGAMIPFLAQRLALHIKDHRQGD